MKDYLKLKSSFWLGRKPAGVLEAREKLWALVPDEGEVANPEENPALEKFRMVSNIYYDVYNNGGCNWKNYEAELRHVSGGKIEWPDLIDVEECDSNYEQLVLLEKLVDRLFRAACKEQGIPLKPAVTPALG